MERKQILLTNDDGIESPGLWKAAEALSKLGFVTVAAPREQSTAMGHSLPINSDGRIEPRMLQIGGQEWTTYAIGGTPGQAVLHAVLEIMPQPPDLVVSGINYGENLGNGITISGTIGAALSAASLGIPALAVSLQTAVHFHLSYSDQVNFSTAAHFTQLFARQLLQQPMPPDVDVLKVDVPDDATPQTAWRITRLARHRYYLPTVHRPNSWEEGGKLGVRLDVSPDEVPADSDIYTLLFDRLVSVTPLSLDMTSRVDLPGLERSLKAQGG